MREIPLDISLSDNEKDEVKRLLGRAPSPVELQLFDVLWSEHCSYKSSKPTLKEYLPTSGPTVLQGPEEDAGILHFTEWQGVKYGIVIAHESHNHPSQILPVEGAATGIGGVVRDVICMGGELIGVLDPLRFGDPEGPNGARSRRIAQGVVKGIAQYGNALGVPNLGGDLFFDRSFDSNCLVNVVALGLVEADRVVPSAVPRNRKEPYVFILVGKPTDSSGFGGATMASKDLEEEGAESKGAVQVPDPFLKRVLNVALAELFDTAHRRRIPIGCKDLGAGGISCMASEIAERGGVGVEIDLDLVPLAEEIPPHVAAVAETQERYGLAIPESFVDDVLALFNEQYDLPSIYRGAQAKVVGRFTEVEQLRILWKGDRVCDASVAAITTGAEAVRPEGPSPAPALERHHDFDGDLGEALMKMLGSSNGASAEPLFRSYDTEVMGNAVIRPGEADAAVILPVHGCPVGAAVTVDGNPWIGALDARLGGAHAMTEAARNLAAVGATPLGVTDCLNYGSPENPEVFRQFVEGVRGIREAADGIGLRDHPGSPIPVVSGNVSFYNQSDSENAVAPSPIICMVGTIVDVSQAVTLRLKQPGHALYLVGERYGELGGSLYHHVIHGDRGGKPPPVRYEEERAAIHLVSTWGEEGLLSAAHDISRGGLLAALAEMGAAEAPHPIGATIKIDDFGQDLSIAERLFTESGGFLIEVGPGEEERFRREAGEAGVPLFRIGEATSERRIRIRLGDETIVDLECESIRRVLDEGLAALFTGV